MDRREFVKAIYRKLTGNERKKVLTAAAAKGFRIPGFTKQPWQAPEPTLNAALMNQITYKRKNVLNCDLVFDAILSLKNKDGTAHILAEAAKMWMQSEENHEMAEKQVEQYSVPEVPERKGDPMNKSEGSMAPNKWRTAYEKAQEEGKKVLEKMDSLREENESLHRANEEYLQVIEALQNQLNALRMDNETLKSKNAELSDALNQMRKERRNVACFGKVSSEKRTLLSGDRYCVRYYEAWTEEVSRQMEEQQFDQVWIVHRGTPYSRIMKIKTALGHRAYYEFLDWAQLVQRMEELEWKKDSTSVS